MGLDQSWLYSEKTRNEVDAGVAVDFTKNTDSLENVIGELHHLAYHRKVPALEQFMANLAKDKGFDDEFNCVYLKITEKDLDSLESKVQLRSLDANASGFFWGTHHDSDYVSIQQSIDLAREKLKQGHYVYYSSWW